MAYIYHFPMFVIQTQMNVTVPSPENCTSSSLCWSDGLNVWTTKNVTFRENIAKCEWNSTERQPRAWAVRGVLTVFFFCAKPHK